jgi:putative ABC transport system ATP-binding protein
MIQLTDITKVYMAGDVPVPGLRGVSLRIEDGEFMSIMGPSGSGKSTLMNIMGALDRPTSGTYELDGVPVDRLPEDQLALVRNRKIGFVFQTFNLLPRQSALENVCLPLLYAGVGKRERRTRVGNRKRAAASALAHVGLANRMSHGPTQLSGGEQQRVAIARCLVTEPSIILADEPTGALDTATSKEVLVMLRNLNEERNITIIIVTHEQEIAAYTRRVVHIRDGMIVDDAVNHSPVRDSALGI